MAKDERETEDPAGGADDARGARAAGSTVARVLPPVLLVLASTLAFAAGLDGEYVLDDVPLVRDSPCVIDPARAVRGLFLLEGGECGYRPLRYVSYAIDRAVWGHHPIGYRATNLALHATAAVLLYLLLLRLFRTRREDAGDDRFERWAAVGGALVFAVHPVQVESVVYLSGRRDVLAGLISIGTMLWWMHRRDDPRRFATGAVTVVLYFLAMQAKESAVVLPGLLWLTEWVRPADAASALRDAGWRARLRAWVAPGVRRPVLFGVLMAMAVGFFAWRGVAAPATSHPGFWGGSRAANTATALGTLPGYARVVAWPDALKADYSPDAYPTAAGFGEARPILGLALVAGLLAALLGCARRRPDLALAAGWVALPILPVMHWVPHHELMAEHQLYLALGGVALALAAGIRAIGRRSMLVAAAGIALVAVPLLLRSAARSLDWRTPRSILESQLAIDDGCARVHWNHARLLSGLPEASTPEGRAREAHHLRRALEIRARSRAGVTRISVPEAAARLALLTAQLGDPSEALRLLRPLQAEVRRRPPRPGARWSAEAEAVHEAFARVLLDLGGTGSTAGERATLGEAVETLGAWLPGASDPQRVHLWRGRARHLLCDLEGAAADYRQAIDGVDPALGAEAAALNVERLVEAGDPAGARSFLADCAERRIASERLDLFRRLFDSGDPPPATRCRPIP